MLFFKNKKKVKSAISASEIRFSYGDKEILKNLNLEIKEGTLTAIIGKSGSGKSTFLKLLSGILSKRYSGKFRIFGWFNFLSKKKIGFVPQEISFIPDLSLEDNIKLIGMNYGVSEKEAIKNANKLLEMLRLNEDLNKKPSQLSGGQKVRFNIILSLLHNPEILILDEPFSGLDFGNRRLLWHFLHLMKKKGKSIVLTSHLLSEIQDNVDKVVILKNGKVFFHGKIEQLKEKLQIAYVYEIRFSRISKDKIEKIEKYCAYYNIPILEKYSNYIMFSLEKEKKTENLQKLFEKLGLEFEVISFRKPNLDEVFLRT